MEVGACVGPVLGAVVGVDVSHVGAISDVQVTDPTPTTLHVRVVAALIVKPGKQRYVAVVGLLSSYANDVEEYVK